MIANDRTLRRICSSVIKKSDNIVPLYWSDNTIRNFTFLFLYKECPILVCWFDDGGHCCWCKIEHTWYITYSAITEHIGTVAKKEFGDKIDEVLQNLELNKVIEEIVLKEK